jgi:hypothetical protein
LGTTVFLANNADPVYDMTEIFPKCGIKHIIFKNQERTTLGTRHKAKTNIKKAQLKRHHRKIKR